MSEIKGKFQLIDKTLFSPASEAQILCPPRIPRSEKVKLRTSSKAELHKGKTSDPLSTCLRKSSSTHVAIVGPPQSRSFITIIAQNSPSRFLASHSLFWKTTSFRLKKWKSIAPARSEIYFTLELDPSPQWTSVVAAPPMEFVPPIQIEPAIARRATTGHHFGILIFL